MSSILHEDYLEITPCVKWSFTTKVKNNGTLRRQLPSKACTRCNVQWYGTKACDRELV